MLGTVNMGFSTETPHEGQERYPGLLFAKKQEEYKRMARPYSAAIRSQAEYRKIKGRAQVKKHNNFTAKIVVLWFKFCRVCTQNQV
jgi:hypothetical protein